MEKYLKYRLGIDDFRIVAYDDLKNESFTIINLKIHKQNKPKRAEWCEYGIFIFSEPGIIVIINENQINTTANSIEALEKFNYPRIFQNPNKETPTMKNKHLILKYAHCLCLSCGKVATPDVIDFDVEIYEPETAVCRFCGWDYIIGLNHIPDYYEINRHINTFIGSIYCESSYFKNLS